MMIWPLGFYSCEPGYTGDPRRPGDTCRRTGPGNLLSISVSAVEIVQKVIKRVINKLAAINETLYL